MRRRKHDIEIDNEVDIDIAKSFIEIEIEFELKSLFITNFGVFRIVFYLSQLALVPN